MSQHLRVNPILCDAYGSCAELLPELIRVDEWGYPIVDDEPIPPGLTRQARRAVALCPRLALAIETRAAHRSPQATSASTS
jgi:ferredoxin